MVSKLVVPARHARLRRLRRVVFVCAPPATPYLNFVFVSHLPVPPPFFIVEEGALKEDVNMPTDQKLIDMIMDAYNDEKEVSITVTAAMEKEAVTGVKVMTEE